MAGAKTDHIDYVNGWMDEYIVRAANYLNYMQEEDVMNLLKKDINSSDIFLIMCAAKLLYKTRIEMPV